MLLFRDNWKKNSKRKTNLRRGFKHGLNESSLIYVRHTKRSYDFHMLIINKSSLVLILVFLILILKLEDFLNTMRHLIHKNAIMVCDIITLNGKWQPGYYKLTLSRPVFPLYRNQSVDLQSKSTDWSLYNGIIGC